MIEIVSGKSSGNAIVVLAIGEEYVNNWRKNSLPNLNYYCTKNNIGLYLQDVSLDESLKIKKLTWQKLLLPSEIKKQFPYLNLFCYIDSDIIVNPYAESVFSGYDSNKLALVSQFKNLPFDINETLKRVAHFRHNYYSEKYPLNSSLFMTISEIYEYHQLSVQKDYACMGFFIGNLHNHADRFTEIYYKYDENIQTLTGGGDEPILNWEFQSSLEIQWLPYKYQAIWLYEMAWKYPHLYKLEKDFSSAVKECIESSLLGNIFLHFAGSWNESQMIGHGPFLWPIENISLELFAYVNKPVDSRPKGIIKP